jgi:aminoglycoside phosphotransferase (APT) family kinase protein
MSAQKMHADEVDIDASLVRRLLAAQFPHWADLPIEPVPSAGTVNALYRLGDHMVVRLPRVERWARSLETEYEWLPKLAPHLPLAIPEPLEIGDPGEGYEWRWCVYRWLNGDTWTTGGVRDLCEAAEDLARFIIALRRIDTAGAPRRPAGYETLARHAYVRPAIAAARGLIDTDAADAAWDTALALPAWDGPPVWVHGDLSRPGNLLVEEGRLTAVIDFGGAGLGDPARELMAAWTHFSGESRHVFRRALAVDDATWARGRAWTLTRVMNVAYYVETNPVIVAEAQHAIAEVLADR